MNKAKLKAYAPAARRSFIRAVTDRAHLMGITETGEERADVRGDVTLIGGCPYPKSLYAQREKLIARIRREGFHHTMEEVAYTWFNRFTALRFMEIHGYLAHGFRVLSHPQGGTTPEILEQAAHVELAGLNREYVLRLKLDGTKDAELYRSLLVAQCDALHRAMPFLFEPIGDDTELLLPDNLLHSDSIIRQLVTETDEADWQHVEIIGWLYQFYISERKDEVIGKVVKSEDIPAATQLFTPNWIVKYMIENSLGRLWLQTYPQSALRERMAYYIEPAAQDETVAREIAAHTPASLDPEALSVLDPACGSGHILVEAYDLLKAIYLERGYARRDIPRLILERNLYGLDIDERAAQLAGFALLMKARADDRRILDAGDAAPRLNVMATGDSAHLDPDELARALTKGTRHRPAAQPLIASDRLFDDFARQRVLSVEAEPQPSFGFAGASERLRSPGAGVSVKHETTETNGIGATMRGIVELFRDARTLGSLVSVPDDVVKGLGGLRARCEAALVESDLYGREAAAAVLGLVRQAEMLAARYDCVVANPPYMGTKYYNSGLKKFVNAKYAKGKADLYGCFVLRCVDLCKANGRVAMLTIPNWMFLSSFEELRRDVISNLHIETLVHNGRGVFGSDFGSCAFVLANEQKPSAKGTFKRLFDVQGSVANNEELSNRFFGRSIFQASSDDFKKVPGSPIAYWVRDEVRQVFVKGKSLNKLAELKQGLATADNNSFLRQWFEVDVGRIGFGLSSREEAQRSGRKWFPYNKGGDFRKWFGNQDYVVNWENDGQAIRSFSDDTGYIRSRAQNTQFYFKQGVTWTDISSSSFGVRFLPQGSLFDVSGSCLFSKSAKSVLALLGSTLSFNLLKILNPTLHFQVGNVGSVPMLESEVALIETQVEGLVETLVQIARDDWNAFETSWDFREFSLLRSDLKAATVEESFSNWRAHCDANIQRMQHLETENNRLFIDAYGLQDELSPDVPLDQVTLARADPERDARRLVSYAIGCMMGRYSLDAPALIYAASGNRDFDSSRYTSFVADPNGIVPVNDQAWFADEAADRLVDFIQAAWSVETLDADLSWLAAQLAPKSGELPRDTVRRYLATAFYKDHLQTYKRRPIYWLFSSGKERAFQCLVYLHRYNESTLSRMRTEYVTPLFGKLAGQIEHLTNEASAAASTAARNRIQRTLDTLKRKHLELVRFDDLLRHYADRRIALDLDDGVRVNYGKFGALLAEVKTVATTTEDG